MFAGNISLSDLFTVLNFLALVALGAYLFKRYFLHAIRTEMSGQEKAFQELKQQKEDLRGQLRFLERSLEEQEKLGAELSAKIQRWHDAYEQNLIKQQVDNERIKLQLHKKVDMQNHYAKLARAQRLLMPAIIKESREALIKKFQEDDAGHDYIAHTLSCLERSKS